MIDDAVFEVGDGAAETLDGEGGGAGVGAEVGAWGVGFEDGGVAGGVD